MEIKMVRILKFNSEGRGTDSTHAKGHRGDRLPSGKHRGIYRRLVPYVEGQVRQSLPRRTELRNFDTIEATKVIEANEKLYINREEGFIGTGLKKDEFIGNCSPIDDVIIFFRDGKYIITPVADKKFVGKNIFFMPTFLRRTTNVPSTMSATVTARRGQAISSVLPSLPWCVTASTM